MFLSNRRLKKYQQPHQRDSNGQENGQENGEGKLEKVDNFFV